MPAATTADPASRSFFRSISRPIMKSSRISPSSEIGSMSWVEIHPRPSVGPMRIPAQMYPRMSGWRDHFATIAKTVAVTMAIAI
jgi:hypothetical protein